MAVIPTVKLNVRFNVDALEKRIADDPKGLASWIARWFSDEPDPVPPPPRETGSRAYALLIGLDRVDPAAYGGWSGDLPSCVNDAKAMRALCGRLGYDSISHMHDSAATRAMVSMRVNGLANLADPGDTVLIFMSRHGGRLAGFDGDGDDSIETHCLYDGQMLDDEFAHLLSGFREGVTVVVIMDACHAEGATKALPYAIRKAMPDDVVERAYRAQEDRYREAKAVAVARPAAPTVVCDVIEMAACGQLESSYAGSPLSQYTHCLVNAMEAANPGDYHMVHASIVRTIRSNQNPKLNGPSHALARPALRP